MYSPIAYQRLHAKSAESDEAGKARARDGRTTANRRRAAENKMAERARKALADCREFATKRKTE